MKIEYSASHWVEQKAIRSQVPDPLQPWLFDSGSMTERLKAFAKQSMTVQRLQQQWGLATHSESLYLKIDLRRRCLIREVYLLCDGKTLVFGRTVFPPQLFEGKGRRLLTLFDTDRPIGELLFKEPTLRRAPLEFCQLTPGQSEFERATQECPAAQEQLWARRSKFYIHDQPLLIMEAFFTENILP